MKISEALRIEADLRDMVEGTAVDWRQCVKYKGIAMTIREWFPANFNNCEFALAIVENKPVFVGDILWNAPNSFTVVVDRKVITNDDVCLWSINDGNGFCHGGRLEDLSWNPPKPKTISIELPYSDVEYWVNLNTQSKNPVTQYEKASVNFFKACKKALDIFK